MAIDVFSELGFERTSMGVVASRARTTKRTVYAHFESKEQLYQTVIEFVRGLHLEKLRSPADYGDDTGDAVVRFCCQFVALVSLRSSIQMCRLVIAEADRFAVGAAQFYDAIFATARSRIADFLKDRLKLTSKEAGEAADGLIGQILHLQLLRSLFGLDAMLETWPDDAKLVYDEKRIRRAVVMILAQWSKPMGSASC